MRKRKLLYRRMRSWKKFFTVFFGLSGRHQPPRVLGIIKVETGHRRYVAALLPELAPNLLYSKSMLRTRFTK